MTLLRFEPMTEFENINSRLQRFLEDFPGMSRQRETDFLPRVEINDHEKEIVIDAEIPGVKKENIKLTLEDNILTLEGKKERTEKKEGVNLLRNERMYGSFKRSFTLAEEVDHNSVQAKFENGVLNIRLKKAEPKTAKERTIELK